MPTIYNVSVDEAVKHLPLKKKKLFNFILCLNTLGHAVKSNRVELNPYVVILLSYFVCESRNFPVDHLKVGHC